MLPVATRNRCSTTSTPWFGSSGTARISPGWLSLKATKPGPCARIMISGIPAMTRIGGCLHHPEFDTRSRISTGAPHRGQVAVPSSLFTIRQYGQVYVDGPYVVMPIPLLRPVVNVHGLDADPAGPGHLGQVHAAPHHAGLDVH